MSQPQTVGDVEILLGSDATKLLSFRKEGDTVYAKPKAYIQDREVFLDILRRCKDIGGRYENGCFIIPLNKPQQATADTPTRTPVKTGFDIVPITSILGIPYTLRLSRDEDEEFQGLTATIQTYGVLEPLIVRPKPDGVLELVCGDRRLRAAKKAGLLEVPVIIKDLDDREAKKLRFIENLQRKDLTDYEKAYALKEMLVDYQSQEELAKDLGKTQGWVAQHLAMLKLEADSITRVITPNLTERQARALLTAPPEKLPNILANLKKRVEAGEELPSAREIEGMVKPPPEHVETPSHIPTEIPTRIPTASPEGSEPTQGRREIDTNAVFTCSICHGKFLIVHLEPSGKHGFKPVIGEAEPE